MDSFSEYPCSLGVVIAHDSGCYSIRTPDGRVIGIVGRGALAAANVEGDIAAPPPPPPPPAVITRAQFIIAARRVLALQEDDILVLIAGMPPGDQRDTARDLFVNALEFRRSNSFLAALAQINGYSSAQLDEVFCVGGALSLD